MIKIKSNVLAKDVYVTCLDTHVEFDDNYFDILPN